VFSDVTVRARGAAVVREQLIEYETVPLPTFPTMYATCCDDPGIMCFDGVASPTCADDPDPRVDTPHYFCCCNGAEKDPVEIPSFFSPCPARNETTNNSTPAPNAADDATPKPSILPQPPAYVATTGTDCCERDTAATCADDTDSDGTTLETVCIDGHSDPDKFHYYCCCSHGQKLEPPFEMPELVWGGCPAPNVTDPPSISPPENRTLYDVISADPTFSTLKGLVDTASIEPLFKGEGTPINLTLFAPTDAAFSELPPGVLDKLRADKGSANLVFLLSYHLLPQKLYTLDLQVGLGYDTLYGKDIAYTSFRMLNGRAGLIQPLNQEASNGILHAIDAVLTKYLDDATETETTDGTAEEPDMPDGVTKTESADSTVYDFGTGFE